MPRGMGSVMAAALSDKVVCPILLVDLAINNETLHIWSGVGTFVWNGTNYTGVGDLGQVSTPGEGIEVQANGASLMLSAVNQADLSAALSDLQLGAPAAIWLGIVDLDTLQLVDQPVALFAGIVDAPSVRLGAEQGANGEPATGMITVPLESRLAVLGAGQQRKYSRADQALKYPDDRAFDWVSLLNYTALRWGN